MEGWRDQERQIQREREMEGRGIKENVRKTNKEM